MNIGLEGTGNCIILQFLFGEKEQAFFFFKIGGRQFICAHVPLDMREDMDGIRQAAYAQDLYLEAALGFVDGFVFADPLVDAGEFIKACQQTGSGALLKQKCVCAPDDEQGALNDPALFQGAAEGDVVCPVVQMGEAGGLQGAVFAMGRLVGAAEGCAKFHQSLIEVGDEAGIGPHALSCLFIQCFLDGGGDFLFDGIFADILADFKAASQYAQYISIDGRYGDAIGLGGDGAGGVGTDAGQTNQFPGIVRQFSSIVALQKEGTLFQVAGAAVVAHAFPEFHEAVVIDRSQGLNIWQFLLEGDEAVTDGFNACLLQHDFADPGVVGVIGVAPWQIAVVLLKPVDQGGCFFFGKFHDVYCTGWAGNVTGLHAGGILFRNPLFRLFRIGFMLWNM